MSTARREIRAIARLAAPVVVTQLGSMMLGVVDVVMLGNYGVEELAAASLARTWLMGTMMIAFGLILGLDPLVSQAYGRHDRQALSLAVQRGLLLALLLSIPLCLAWLFTEDVLLLFRQEAGLAALGGDYALARIPGVPFWVVFMALRGWLQGRRIMKPAMFVVLVANLANVAGNWALIFGHLGLPELGVVGAGIASSITQVCMLVTLVVLVRARRLYRGAWLGWSRQCLEWSGVAKVLRMGGPIAVQIGLEIWAFQLGYLWAGWLGKVPVASHAVALTLASISFMVPLGISIGAATRVGNLVGARSYDQAQRSAHLAIGMGTASMAVFALAFVVWREELPLLFTDSAQAEAAAVVALSAAILPIAAAFQLFDGMQVVAGGILRGMGRTRPAAVAHLVAFYVIGLPLAYWLTFRRGWELEGIWWGLCVAIGVVSLALSAWVWRRGPASLAP